MLEKNPETVKLVMLHYPLSFHKLAQPAAQASIAAQRQGKFWEYAAKVFTTKGFTAQHLDTFARELNLDMARFNRDRQDRQTLARVRADMATARRAEVNSTPSIFINGWRYQGPRSPAAFQQRINEELAKETVGK